MEPRRRVARIRSALGYSVERLTVGLNAGFRGHVVPVRMTPGGFSEHFRQSHVDFAHSLVGESAERIVGVLLLGRRGWNSYVAAMGVSPAHRGTGLAARLMEHALDGARARGDRRVVLEVAEQNPRAVRFYEKMGFATTRRLAGYERGPARGRAAKLIEMDPPEFAHRVALDGERDLPWMLAAETLGALGRPHRAYALGEEAAALVAETPGAMHLRGLVVSRSERRRGHATRLLGALFARHPGVPWKVSTHMPDTLAPEFLGAMGFVEGPISLFEMELRLPAPASPPR